MHYSTIPVLAAVVQAVMAGPVPRQASVLDPNTTKYCTLLFDTIEGDTCDLILDSFTNPSITAGCGNFQPGHSYCVEAKEEPTDTGSPNSPVTSSTTATKTSTTQPSATATTGDNGIATPIPFADGMTTTCRSFYKVRGGYTCDAVISTNNIDGSSFYKWNPSLKEDCSNLHADVYYCIQASDGVTPTTTPIQVPSTATATPFPMIPFPDPNEGNPCHLFQWVSTGGTCAGITKEAGISSADFYYWNSNIKKDCTNLAANSYVCVRGDPSPTTTKPPTGVTTPTPIQTGMVSNCKTFYFVQSGDTCDSIAAARNINKNDFIRWNPAVGSSCTGMWAKTWACVGV